jgi:hypothetical protein
MENGSPSYVGCVRTDRKWTGVNSGRPLSWAGSLGGQVAAAALALRSEARKRCRESARRRGRGAIRECQHGCSCGTALEELHAVAFN